MAKRFIDTGYFKSPFVRGLEAPLKLLYSFIICDCSPAGIWTVDLEVAALYCGTKITQEQAEKVFIKTGKAIDLKNGKWFLPGFIEHQYPQGLSEKNPAQKNLISELKNYDLIDEDLKLKPTDLIQGHRSPSEGAKVMVMEIVKEKDKVKEQVEEKESEHEVLIYPTFDDFWNLYDKKVGREKSEKKWGNLSQSEKEKIMEYLPGYIASTPDVQYRKNPETFLNNKSWNDEIITRNDNERTISESDRLKFNENYVRFKIK